MLVLMLLRVKAAFKFWISYADMVLLLNAVLQQQCIQGYVVICTTACAISAKCIIINRSI